ncbi:hypothetical protein M5M_00912 [Simiduia agarivorans SA1 = DSM 21679]|uniref:Uncharacterized protein n=1 Tax=Simiduia agarivorans (strain DSM 21679 / JCM 13881 / BCRC 17597 / SA1) TaxID=1117647 RepID=R9S4Z5_SIMAS|nr:hypothetical protein M5M_00912 [Simiduia agarivorans SA1 = DSM 21679]
MMAETSGDKLYLGFLLLVYFVIWVAVCSLWFKPVLLLQASIFAGFYLVSHAIGVFGRGKIGLSADGVQTLLLVPAFLLVRLLTNGFWATARKMLRWGCWLWRRRF